MPSLPYVFNLDNRISWSTVSNAFLRSKKTTALILRRSILYAQSSVASSKAVSDSRMKAPEPWLNPDECYLRSLKNSRVHVLFKFHEKPSYYVLKIYIRMFETIAVLTYVYSESFTDKFPCFVISHYTTLTA